MYTVLVCKSVIFRIGALSTNLVCLGVPWWAVVWVLWCRTYEVVPTYEMRVPHIRGDGGKYTTYFFLILNT